MSRTLSIRVPNAFGNPVIVNGFNPGGELDPLDSGFEVENRYFEVPQHGISATFVYCGMYPAKGHWLPGDDDVGRSPMTSWSEMRRRPVRWGGVHTSQCALLPALRQLLPALRPTVVIVNRGYLMRKLLSAEWLGALNASFAATGRTVWKTLSGNDGSRNARGYAKFVHGSVVKESTEAELVAPFFTHVLDAAALTKDISAPVDLWDSARSVPLFCDDEGHGPDCPGIHLNAAPNNLLNRRLLQLLYPQTRN